MRRRSGFDIPVDWRKWRERTIPRFVVDRPSGEREPPFVAPDIVLPDSLFDRRRMVDALLDRLRSAGAGAGAP